MQPGPELAILALRILIIACLYLFLAWVALVARRGVGSRALVRAAPRRLVILDAPGVMPGVALALQERTTIGRAAENTVVVSDPAVSARHAAVTVAADGCWLEDLGSTNGTMVNGQWVGAPVRVGVGDEIAVGPARLRLDG